MDNRSETRTFLSSRRARLTPERAGLPAWGTNRRVTGLRRGEVAMLAGVSVEYYTRLERGNLSGVSDSVLDAVARALQLDETEHAHLLDLARTANTTPGRVRRRPAQSGVRPGVIRILESMGVPAYVRNNRFDVLAANPLGRALYAEVWAAATGVPNTARSAFLDPRARQFWVDWERIARDCAGALRIQAGKNPYDRELSNLIGELSTRSDEFRTWWAEHDVHVHSHGVKRLRHAVIGTLDLSFEAMELPEGLTLIAYSAEPGTPSADALKLLESWSVTEQPSTAG
ncbi:helix-turn-helix transcriptional regulator [Winogradskya humida]|uniref:Transcriptional regulator n=1 Tax=Winogradskya humida TaxID=113566 RepID=A0ABQ3ZEA5_9ACTN|nr:helix-turn-helix transcriptional regulator [Actinoplanes humidus]GIE16903.1 transcriptional regulator [Actinoplanes humidus]